MKDRQRRGAQSLPVGRVGLALAALAALVALLGSLAPAHDGAASAGPLPLSSPSGGAVCDAGCTPDPGSDGAGRGASASPLMTGWTLGGPGWLLDTSGFPRRWNCGTWSAGLGWLHIGSDLAIWGAYMAIPLVLAGFVVRRRSPLPMVSWLFIAFIASCGIGHLIEAAMFWTPLYRLGGAWKLVTATVSWATVAALIPVVPRALRWPRLDEVNQKLSAEIELRALAAERLERAAVELRRRNEELERFVYTASHDLKSPLVTILGYAKHIKRDTGEGRTAELAGHAEKIIRASNRLRGCVDDLLELSRVGCAAGPPEEVDLHKLLSEVLDLIQEPLEERGIRVRERFGASRLVADPKRIGQVLQNLVANAVRYGCPGPGSCIEVGSVDAEGECRLYVRDQGAGIAPEHHARVFELFQRISEDGDGTGVGLAIVRRIAETHGGRCWVESELGRGATFWVSFPFPKGATSTVPAFDMVASGAD